MNYFNAIPELKNWFRPASPFCFQCRDYFTSPLPQIAPGICPNDASCFSRRVVGCFFNQLARHHVPPPPYHPYPTHSRNAVPRRPQREEDLEVEAISLLISNWIMVRNGPCPVVTYPRPVGYPLGSFSDFGFISPTVLLAWCARSSTPREPLPPSPCGGSHHYDRLNWFSLEPLFVYYGATQSR